MKLGIMQPYYVPYIGYWQLLNAVDKYVIYDDVNFIKGGWINRNRILLNGEPHYFNISMLGASPNKLINEININNDLRLINKNLRILKSAYEKAPYFESVYPMIYNILNYKTDNLAEYIKNSIEIICKYLKIDTELILSSSLDKDCSLRGQEKVISICNKLKADEYYNAIGGQKLYCASDFMKYNIKLSFLKTNDISYKQFDNKFQENLSIIDVIMFNSSKEIGTLLTEYTLIH